MTGISHLRVANCRSLLVGLLLMGLVGCPAPTPDERIGQIKGTVVQRGNGVIDLDLSNTSLSDSDFSYVHAFCANSSRAYKSVHTLNLTNTSITDNFLDAMTLQQGRFTSESGLRELILTGTDTSDEAVHKYQTVNPECRIIR